MGQSVVVKIEEAEKFMGSVRADRDSKQLWQDPSFTLEQVLQKIQLLKSETEAVFNAPIPAADEKMKDESKEATAD